MPAEVLLARAFVEKRFFDLIDLDAFGSPSALIQLVLQVLAFDGVLLLASTDGRPPPAMTGGEPSVTSGLQHGSIQPAGRCVAAAASLARQAGVRVSCSPCSPSAKAAPSAWL